VRAQHLDCAPSRRGVSYLLACQPTQSAHLLPPDHPWSGLLPRPGETPLQRSARVWGCVRGVPLPFLGDCRVPFVQLSLETGTS